MFKIPALLKPKQTSYEQMYNVKFYNPKEVVAPKSSILVYTSNSHGKCGKGASHLAIHNFRAMNGSITGRTGDSYALHLTQFNGDPIHLKELTTTMRALKLYVNSSKTKLFFVSEIYEEVDKETFEFIAPQFKGLKNLLLPEKFEHFVKG